MRKLVLPALVFLLACSTPGQPSRETWTVDVERNLKSLIQQEDTDQDLRVTVLDRLTPYVLTDSNGVAHPIEGVYPLSVLLQELGRAQLAGKKALALSPATIRENPVTRTSRMIRENFWQGLTRSIDRQGLSITLPDPKMPASDGHQYLYVAKSDPDGLAYFKKLAADMPELKMKVVTIPEKQTPSFAKEMERKPGLLALNTVEQRGERKGSPFVVPGGRFNVMYGWDSYFITLGLLEDGKLEESRAMVDNHVYEAAHYGKVLNGNRSYYLTRSQPPFLAAMALAVYAKLPRTAENKMWLARALLGAISEYRGLWMAEPRLDAATGLSRYWGVGKGPCPEVHQPLIYEPVLKPRAQKYKLSIPEFLKRFKAGKIQDAELDKYFLDDRALRESGHDRTYRFEDRTSDFLTVDLNSLLYKEEIDIADALDREFGGFILTEKSADWRARAARRKQVMNELMWDEKAGLFFDYDTAKKKRSQYITATSFYPLWAGLATPEQAEKTVAAARGTLIMKCGLAATAEASRGPITEDHPKRQWDYPNGWAPHQMLAWVGLENYGMKSEAQDLVYRWLYAITKNVTEYNGSVPEKLDVTNCSQQMRAGKEFDNVGTDFKYVPNEGFGWMNASFQVGLKMLSPTQVENLKGLQSP